MAALNDNYVGEYAIIWFSDDWELCYVADVAQLEHGLERDRLGLIVEVDYNTAQRHDLSNVKVSLLPRRCSTLPHHRAC